jgi:hypothetical protein
MTADRWNSWPSHKSQTYFLGMMDRHDNVRAVETLAPNRYIVTLNDRTTVTVFMTDVYEFTVSDYEQLRERFPEVNCIVMASEWNHFTTAAREEARAEGIATFHFKGLMGALNYTGDDFLDYPDSLF